MAGMPPLAPDNDAYEHAPSVAESTNDAENGGLLCVRTATHSLRQRSRLLEPDDGTALDGTTAGGVLGDVTDHIDRTRSPRLLLRRTNSETGHPLACIELLFYTEGSSREARLLPRDWIRDAARYAFPGRRGCPPGRLSPPRPHHPRPGCADARRRAPCLSRGSPPATASGASAHSPRGLSWLAGKCVRRRNHAYPEACPSRHPSRLPSGATAAALRSAGSGPAAL